MPASRETLYLRHVVELCKAGSRLPVRSIEALIAAGPEAEGMLVDLVRSRAVRDDTWGPLWAILALGERRSAAAVPPILESLAEGNDLIHEGAEFALQRIGPAAVPLILRHLEEHPASEGRGHLYAVLARSRDRAALDYLIGQLRRDEDCRATIAWALAETRDPRALAAIDVLSRRLGRAEPELAEALEAAATIEPSEPGPEDWRAHWTWEDADEPDEKEAQEPAETGGSWSEGEGEPPSFLPRCYDVVCPGCRSRLEFDTSDGSSRIVQPGFRKERRRA